MRGLPNTIVKYRGKDIHNRNIGGHHTYGTLYATKHNVNTPEQGEVCFVEDIELHCWGSLSESMVVTEVVLVSGSAIQVC